MEYAELIESYRDLCFSLGKDNEIGIHLSRSELLNEIGHLEFEWIHERCM